ncbi:glycosyltransferase family 4 protein [Marinagarivorans algicola]|uniref:glycosyltransferase family 4 protein n=1 Tax=Marinagarivorans algicola TaxID=1513270 RepID=UPI0006B9A649|nr:glycosyltransferase family 4 protein [Marinagarivorans algicola]
MKILHIQYAGDFPEAYNRLIKNNGKENYYGQRYSVNSVVQQAKSNISVMVLTLKTEGYRVKLENNLIAVGMNKNKTDYTAIENEISQFSPDSVILRTPDHKILRFLRKRQINTLPVFADSFENIPIWKVKTQLRHFMLARELKSKSIKWVANHQINAAKSLKNLGINPSKILPYDWEHSDNPSNWKKNIPNNLTEKKIVIFYAGTISHSKGVFDLVRAMSELHKFGRDSILRIAGKGDEEKLINFASNLGISSQIEMLGLINHEEVFSNMNESDVVVVPSRHSYPEGLPMTIMESLMVHTPVVASDHPMFIGRVGLRGSVVFFRERDSVDLSEKIVSICSNLDTYKKMSKNAKLEWQDLNLKLKWAEMINKWISNPSVDLSQFVLSTCDH